MAECIKVQINGIVEISECSHLIVDAREKNAGKVASTQESDYPNSKHKQAALFIHKGEDNAKFETTNNTRRSEIAYQIIYHPAYYWFNLLTAVALLILALKEEPSVHTDQHPKGVELSLLICELILLLFLGFNLLLRLVWLGPKLFFRSRGIFVSIFIIIMFIEVFFILTLDKRHIRITRALRPFILLDTFLMSSVRRVVRQIFRCLKYIIDVMLVLFFFIAVFALMAYFLFSNNNKTYFDDLDKSFVSMLITLTTANHPDVFMESYYYNSAAPLFFMVYIFVTFYYFSNVLLAVVFAKFKEAEKSKCKELFLHRRSALRKAYDILKKRKEGEDREEGEEREHREDGEDREDGEEREDREDGEDREEKKKVVHFIDFLYCMQIYKPQLTVHELMCVFKSLKQTPDGTCKTISWDEFSGLYENLGLKWEMIHKTGYAVAWYEDMKCLSSRTKIVMKGVHNFIRHWIFDSIMTGVVLSNLLCLILFIHFKEDECDNKGVDQFCAPGQIAGLVFSFVFNFIYIGEILVRLFLDGPVKYFRKWWNWMDFTLVVGPFVCLCIEVSLITLYGGGHAEVRFLAIARPLKLLRLLKLKRYLIHIMIVLAERIISVLVLLLLVFYVYAIIGMEIFSGPEDRVYPGCCSGGWYNIEQFYSNNGSIHDSANLFWLNNFDNITRSYVTLYELMVVNNWFIQMEGFVSTTSAAARIFFILFWITTTLVVNIAIVYIVDAFESVILALNIQRQNEESVIGEIPDLKKVVTLQLLNGDIDEMEAAINITCPPYNLKKKLSPNLFVRKLKTISPSTIRRYEGEFCGRRIMNNDDLRMFMYKADLDVWREEHDQRDDKEIGKYVWKTFKQIVHYILV